jgi:WhiB family redox-sensing transcriptional regulator
MPRALPSEDEDYCYNDDEVERPSPFDVPWYPDAACFGMGWDLYFHEGKLRAKAIAKQAKSYCVRCPVQADCLLSSLEHRDVYGIWGGLTPRERRLLLREIDLGMITVEQAIEGVCGAQAA